MYAVIKTGGKQYRVQEGDYLKIEKIKGEIGDAVSFDDVLLFSDDSEVLLGNPNLENIKVNGVIREQWRNRKIIVFKFKRRKRYRKTQGHRQAYTAVQIQNIER